MHMRGGAWRGDLRGSLAFPRYGDPVARYDAATCEFVALAFAIGGAVALAAMLSLRLGGAPHWDDARSLNMVFITFGGVAMLVPAFCALWIGRVALANQLLVWLAYAGVTAATWCGGPLPNPGMFGYVLVVVTAGVLAPGRGAVAVGATSVVTISCIAFLQQNYPSGAPEPPESLTDFVLSLAMTGAIMTAILIRTSRRARSAISQAVDQQKILEHQNRELRAHEARFRGIVDHTREMVAEIDADGRFVYASPNHLEVTGRTADELLGRLAWEFIHPDDIQQRSGENPVPGLPAAPIRVRVADGSWRWVEMAVTAFLAADGQRRMLSVTRDITARIAAEEREAQRRAAASHAQKMEALGRLAGGITHELNNLMTVISLNVELLDGEGKLPHGALRSLEHIRDSAEQATDLTRRLLGFARPAQSSETCVEVDAQVRELGCLLRPLVGESVDFDLALAADGGHVEVCQAELAQLVMNLVVNARGAVGDNGTIRISTRDVEFHEPYACHSGSLSPGRYVGLSVSDTGCGMDEETRARIFEPFFTTREDAGGTGLGLALVYGIVRRATGDVWVESKVGAGTRVEALLPRVAAPVRAARAAGQDPGEARGSETVLVVEDQPNVRLAMSRIVRSLGYRVLEARSGDHALEIERSLDERLHLLLTDVVMPGMQGPELARLLVARRPALRVLFLTGYAGQAFAGERTPDHPVLYKPAGRDVLAAKLRAVLDSPAPGTSSELETVAATFPVSH